MIFGLGEEDKRTVLDTVEGTVTRVNRKIIVCFDYV